MKTFLLRLGRGALLAYIALILLVAGCQNSLLYFPKRGEEDAMIRDAQRQGIQPWRDAQGRLIGWHRPNPRAANRLVVFHGNAGLALDRSHYIDGFEALSGGADWEVWILEYPGYGSRSGSPGKKAFIDAGRQALKQLPDADSRPLHLLGESVGTGTACALTAEMPDLIAGLALVVPFARLQEVAQEKFRWLPVGLLLRDKFDNIAALSGYRGRVAVVVADSDEVVGAAQGRKLHDSYSGPKLLLVLSGAGHNSFDTHETAPWFGKAGAFLRAAR